MAIDDDVSSATRNFTGANGETAEGIAGAGGNKVDAWQWRLITPLEKTHVTTRGRRGLIGYTESASPSAFTPRTLS